MIQVSENGYLKVTMRSAPSAQAYRKYIQRRFAAGDREFLRYEEFLFLVRQWRAGVYGVAGTGLPATDAVRSNLGSPAAAGVATVAPDGLGRSQGATFLPEVQIQGYANRPQPGPGDIAALVAKQVGVPSVLVDLAQGKVNPVQVLQAAITNPSAVAAALPAAIAAAPLGIALGGVGAIVASIITGLESEAEKFRKAEAIAEQGIGVATSPLAIMETIANPRRLKGVVTAA